MLQEIFKLETAEDCAFMAFMTCAAILLIYLLVSNLFGNKKSKGDNRR